MAVKYVKDFEFSKDAGFSGSCGPMKKAMGGKVNGPLNKIMDAVRRSPQAQQMMAESMQRREMAERPVEAAPQQPQPTMMRKGGKVTSKKGQAKVAKVMREYKEGKLHSGSKKGPKVTNPKQAMAIALSEARAMKKAKGGEVEKPKKKEESKKPKMKMEDLALKKMRHAEKYAPGMDLDNIHSYELSQEAKKEKKVEKYQAGGLAERRAANAAKRQAGFDARMAAEKARRQPGKDAFKARMEAARARRAARTMGMKKGGEVHSDVKMDKAMIRKAVHKHESEKHPGESKTKLKKGGLPVHQGSPMYGRK
jgi:hypothetical protein